MSDSDKIGVAAEERWADFFPGSILAQDVIREKGQQRYGLEQGGDLLLGPVWRKMTGGAISVIQVKWGLERAIEFLHEGGLRGEIIPVVVGIPPVEGYQKEVLRRLVGEYVWYPRRAWMKRHSDLVNCLDNRVQALQACRIPLLQAPPPWCCRYLQSQ